VAVFGWRPAVAQVVEERLADDDRQGESGGMARLALGHRKALALPVDVVECLRRDLSAPQPIGDEQEQDGVVALARLGPPIDRAECAVDVVPGDRAGNAREPVELGPLDSPAQIRAEDSLPVRVAEEHSQRPRAVAHRALGQTGSGPLDDVGAEDRRRQLANAADPDPTQVGLEAVELVAVAEQRGGPKAPLVGEVVEEPGEPVKLCV
jgi:hypothetical protein